MSPEPRHRSTLKNICLKDYSDKMIEKALAMVKSYKNVDEARIVELSPDHKHLRFDGQNLTSMQAETIRSKILMIKNSENATVEKDHSMEEAI